MFRIFKIIFQIILALPLLAIIFFAIGWFSFFQINDENIVGNWDAKIVGDESMHPRIAFHDDSTVDLSLGCNAIGGKYSTQDSRILFHGVSSTRIHCDGTAGKIEDQFTKLYLKGQGEKQEYAPVSGRKIGKHLIVWRGMLFFFFDKAE